MALADRNLFGVWGDAAQAERRRIHRRRVAEKLSPAPGHCSASLSFAPRPDEAGIKTATAEPRRDGSHADFVGTL